MPFEVPFTSKPEDITRLFELLPTLKVPAGVIDARYLKTLGFSAGSGGYLADILRKLGFLNAKDKPSAAWLAYVRDEKRGMVLATALKKAYADLFAVSSCPYLEDDGEILDYFKRSSKGSDKETVLMLQTFRNLSEPADFQDLMCEGGTEEKLPVTKNDNGALNVKVNPNLQISLQVHIDPGTSDEKIEAIFRNMRKYLLGKEG